MKKLEEKSLNQVIGGTNWMAVGGACVNGFIGTGIKKFNLKSAGVGCVKAATKTWAKEKFSHKRKH